MYLFFHFLIILFLISAFFDNSIVIINWKGENLNIGSLYKRDQGHKTIRFVARSCLFTHNKVDA